MYRSEQRGRRLDPVGLEVPFAENFDEREASHVPNALNLGEEAFVAVASDETAQDLSWLESALESAQAEAVEETDAEWLETEWLDTTGVPIPGGEMLDPIFVSRRDRSGDGADPSNAAPASLPIVGPGVTFPSGLVLRIVAGAVGKDEEHYDPNHVDLPLLDTGPAVQGQAISNNFKVREFVVSGGAAAPVSRISPDLVRAVQAIRDRAGKPVTINSGYRSYKRNIEVYKSINKRRAAKGLQPTRTTASRHSSGQAVDLKIAGMTGTELAKLAIDAAGPDLGIGLASDFIHVDVRGTTTVWDYGGSAAADRKEVLAYAVAAKRRRQPPAPKPTPSPSPSPPAPMGNRIIVNRLPLLASHAGTHPDLILRWNDIAHADTVDLVIHFHGFADGPNEKMDIRRHKEPISGLDLTNPTDPTLARSRPTVTVLPRGHFKPAPPKHPGAYKFPALLTKTGLDQLIEEVLRLVGARFLRSFSLGRLILTAHSGGGAAVDAALHHVDPDEVHLYDATYTDPATLLAWAKRRIVRDLANPQAPAPALRAIFNPVHGTGPRARELSHGLCALLAAPGAARLATRFQVDQTAVPHGKIPGTFGWHLLVDAGATLPSTRPLTCTGGSAREEENEANAGEELAWLDYEARATDFEEEGWPGETTAMESEFESGTCPHCAGEDGSNWSLSADNFEPLLVGDEAEENETEFEAQEDADEYLAFAQYEPDREWEFQEIGHNGEDEWEFDRLELEAFDTDEDEVPIDGEAPLWRLGANFSRTATAGADIVGIIRDDGQSLVAVDRAGKATTLAAARVGSLEGTTSRPLFRCRLATLTPVKGGAVGALRATLSGSSLFVLQDGTVLLRRVGKVVVPAATTTLPVALRATLTYGTRIEIRGTSQWVWMTFRLRDETAERSRWVQAKATRKSIDDRRRDFDIAARRFTALERALVDPHLDLMATISVIEGGFDAKSWTGDTHVSLGIFQWAMARNQSKQTGSLGRFFGTLKQRAAAGTDPLYARAWADCTGQGLDFRDVDRVLTLNGADATGAQVEAAMSGTMATEALSSYQLRAGVDWIDEFRATPATPGPAGAMFLGHEWTVLGANKVRLTSSRARRKLEVSLLASVTIAQIFASEGALASAVMLGVNRPNYVRLALWRALGTSADPKAETNRLVNAVIDACMAARSLPPSGRPFTETEVNGAGPAAQSAYAALQRFLIVPTPPPPTTEAVTRATFEAKAMLLYNPDDARKFRREARFATVRVRFP